MNIASPVARPKDKKLQPVIWLRIPILGACFPILLCPLIVAVQLAPHMKPEGQHPPPSFEPHANHPLLQVPCGPAAVDVGEAATMVMLVLVTTTVLP